MRKLFSLLVLLLFVTSVNAKSKPEFWTWLSYGDAKNVGWDKYLDELKDVGLTGIILSANPERMQEVTTLANAKGIKVQAWVWIMNNRAIAKEHPDWLDYNQKGESMKDKHAYVEYYKFLNPAVPGVKEAIVEQVAEIAKIDGIEGISLDYCRYVDAILPTSLWQKYDIIQEKIHPEWDYGYHPVMIEAFKKEYGYDPREQKDPSMDAKWHQFRMDKVNDVVAALREVADDNKIELTASPFPTPNMSRRMVYQDWGKWELDRAFPMIYNGFYYGGIDWIVECVQDCRRDMYKKAKLYCGLFVPDYEESKESTFTIYEAMDAAIEAGAKGISFFTYNSFKTDEQKAELKAYISSKK